MSRNLDLLKQEVNLACSYGIKCGEYAIRTGMFLGSYLLYSKVVVAIASSHFVPAGIIFVGIFAYEYYIVPKLHDQELKDEYEVDVPILSIGFDFGRIISTVRWNLAQVITRLQESEAPVVEYIGNFTYYSLFI